MSRKKAGSAWMRRHVADVFVQRSVREGYRSRAAYKLQEIDRRDRLMAPGMAVVDLGAAPGGWSQVARERVGASGRVVAVDVLPMKAVPGVMQVSGDILEPGTVERVIDSLGGAGADLVLSDMAPNLTGVAATDQARCEALVEAALAVALRVLKPGGAMVVKLFHGSGFERALALLGAGFGEVVVRKPEASRSRSSEAYAVAKRRLKA